jgi:GNAT superfamily N-acetyltransferase
MSRCSSRPAAARAAPRPDWSVTWTASPVGWVAVEPRENYPRIWARQKSWMRKDPDLEGVWSVTCFVVRKGFRRQGLMHELAAATVEYGRQVGARVLEGYPTEPPPGKNCDLGRGLGRAAPSVPRCRLRGRGLAHTAPQGGATSTRRIVLTIGRAHLRWPGSRVRDQAEKSYLAQPLYPAL